MLIVWDIETSNKGGRGLGSFVGTINAKVHWRMLGFSIKTISLRPNGQQSTINQERSHYLFISCELNHSQHEKTRCIFWDAWMPIWCKNQNCYIYKQRSIKLVVKQISCQWDVNLLGWKANKQWFNNATLWYAIISLTLIHNLWLF